MLRRLIVFISTLWIGSSFGDVAVEARPSLGIGDMPQLFADDYLVASPKNIRRIARRD